MCSHSECVFTETRRLTFKTCYFGTFALLQDVHINMPFQSWEVRPKGLNNCLLTLIAAIVELEIEVKVRAEKNVAFLWPFLKMFLLMLNTTVDKTVALKLLQS